MTEKKKIALCDVPETMLWTLHNRASEAMRSDGYLQDEKCLDIYRAIDYDYQRHFGKADGSHAVRSRIFDDKIRAFLVDNPNAVIINLGEGLETQRFRIDAPEALWVSIDLPEAMEVRERFITPDDQHIHIATSALDTSWFARIPENRPVFITAQGLFMYFTEAEMATFIAALAKRFPKARLMFDHLNPTLSNRTMSASGWMKTKDYRTPLMPWGVRRDRMSATLSQWIGSEVSVHYLPFTLPRGFRRYLVSFLEKIPFISKYFPGVCYVDFPEK